MGCVETLVGNLGVQLGVLTSPLDAKSNLST